MGSSVASRKSARPCSDTHARTVLGSSEPSRAAVPVVASPSRCTGKAAGVVCPRPPCEYSRHCTQTARLLAWSMQVQARAPAWDVLLRLKLRLRLRLPRREPGKATLRSFCRTGAKQVGEGEGDEVRISVGEKR